MSEPQVSGFKSQEDVMRNFTLYCIESVVLSPMQTRSPDPSASRADSIILSLAAALAKEEHGQADASNPGHCKLQS